LVDLATSVNTDIIGFSKKYQFNFYALFILAILNIASNLYFIPKYDIVGAAIATFCSLSLFNLVKLIFIWINFKMQPFTFATVKILLLAGLCWAMIYFIPFDFHPIVNIMLRSVLLTIVYGGLTLYLEISPDVNGMVRSGLGKLKDYFGK
jgi:O-antigen/teichoic acid export membrane protein